MKKIWGGLLAFAGFILSPLSWWNDLLVNIPLAYVFALPFGFLNRALFLPMMILGYWITNVAGFLLMHRGLQTIRGIQEQDKKKALLKNVGFSVIYSIAVSIAFLTGIISFPSM